MRGGQGFASTRASPRWSVNHIRTLILATLALGLLVGSLAIDEIAWAGDARAEDNLVYCIRTGECGIWPPYDCIDGVQDCDGPPDS